MSARLSYSAIALCISAGTLSLVLQTTAPEPDRSLVNSDVSLSKQTELLQAMSAAELRALIDRERRIIVENPLDNLAPANLAALRRAQGDTVRADALTMIAAQHGLRNLRIQVEALDLELRRKDYGNVTYQLDALIRARPNEREKFYGILYGLAAQDDARRELVSYLVKKPSWRQDFLKTSATSGQQPLVIYQLLVAMREAGATIGNDELRPLLARLIGDKNFDLAYFVWLDFLSQNDLHKVGNVFDGNFELSARNLFFDWTENSLSAVGVHTGPRASGSADQVLQISLAGGQLSEPAVQQILRLQSGKYVLSGEGRTENLDASAGLVWDIRCLDGGSQIARSQPFMASTQWATFETKFAVPETGCSSQVLALEAGSAAKLDQIIRGRAFFDNIKVVSEISAE